MAEQGLIELLQKLVAIPSVNPLLASDPRIGTEKPLAEFLAAYLNQKGFRVEWHEITPGRPNVVGRFGPDQPKRTLLIESHLDTQGVHGMTIPPFDPQVREGRLYGRGACDTKGPMAAALWALSAELLDSLSAACVQVIYVGAVGEEKGNVGAEQLVDLEIGADEALILEPTELAIVHAHKGTLWYEIEVQGRAAHGSNPEQGLNAVRAMALVMDDIAREIEQARLKHTNPLLGPPTVNIGLIRGGSSINIVPDRCVIEVDRRTVPGEDNAAILGEIRAGLIRLQALGAISGWQLTPIKDGTPFETKADTPLVQRLAASCVARGAAGRTEGAGWYSDAGPFARSCREVAVFGPGSIKQAHTADEFIELASLQQGVDILREFLARLAVEAKESA
ncbi:MAG TPA: M20 family metallopeptidase [Kiritimatiellia bacterium]|nr:M20 family metallopeptidase [Kiritimatiellia bacterium]